MTARAPPRICPENAFMKENYIQTKLKGICFHQKFPVICQKEAYEQIPNGWVLQAWCPAPNLLFSTLPHAGSCSRVEQSHVPRAGAARKVAEHRQAWDTAKVLKGQGRRGTGGI